MDNPSFGKDDAKEKGIELSVGTNGASSLEQGSVMASCSPQACQNARRRYPAPDLRGSPWHTQKTVFFVGLLVLLGVWIIVFSVLSSLNLL